MNLAFLNSDIATTGLLRHNDLKNQLLTILRQRITFVHEGRVVSRYHRL